MTQNNSDSTEPNWQWRIAAKFDIGSVARFGDSDSQFEDWTYGILKDVVKCPDYGWQYVIAEDYYNRDGEKFLYCQIQHDANKEP